jgi:hypothetical protein
MTDLLCARSGTLVTDPDAIDGNGVLRPPCDCGRTVTVDDTPAGPAIRRHPMFPTRAGAVGAAEALLMIVADVMVPTPGGRVRAEIPGYTAERIRHVVDDLRRQSAARAAEAEAERNRVPVTHGRMRPQPARVELAGEPM